MISLRQSQGMFFLIKYKEDIWAFDALAFSVYYFYYALEEESHLVGKVLVPDFGVFRVVAQLAVLQELAGVFIEYGYGPYRY